MLCYSKVEDQLEMQVLWMPPAALQHMRGTHYGIHTACNQNPCHFDHEGGGPAGLLYPASDLTYFPGTWQLFRDNKIEKPQKNATATTTVSKESSAGTTHDFY